MRNVELVNNKIRSVLAEQKTVISYGQNVSLGSCIGGLTKNLPNTNNSRVINTTNCENTLAGVGFGLLLENIHSVFFLKQQDFLTLSVDHLVNTWSSVRNKKLNASLTFFCVTMNGGYEGPQSSLNSICDFCSIANMPGFTISNAEDTSWVISRQLVSIGVRVIAISQQFLGQEIKQSAANYELIDSLNGIHRYGTGGEATIISLNHAFEVAHIFSEILDVHGVTNSLFNFSAILPVSMEAVIEHARKTNRVFIFDDTKSANKPAYNLSNNINRLMPNCIVSVHERNFEPGWSSPNEDKFELNLEKIVKKELERRITKK